MPQAACRMEDRELFFPKSGIVGRKPTKALQRQWDRAKEICQTCPVMHQCRRDTLGEERGVWGGLDEYERYLVRRALPSAAKRWPKSRRLALGRILWELRRPADPSVDKTPRVTWQTIRTMTGIGPELGQELANEYAASIRPRVSKRKTNVVDLSLERAIAPFPKEKGQRHMWVRHNGRCADGWYRGESLDGRRILVEVANGRHHSQKWVLREDVKFHWPIPRYVVSHEERVA